MDGLYIALPIRSEPLVVPWPSLGNLGGMIQFEHRDQWHAFIRSLDIDCQVPHMPIA